MSLIVDIFPAREDNFAYLAHDEATGRTAAIDAPDETAIRAALNRHGWTLSDILITHHHADHTDAIAPLKQAFGATVTGPKDEADKIGSLDVLVSDGDEVDLGATRLHVIATPGHTLGHICYYVPSENGPGHLFSADALFSVGVGRMFEGRPGEMWDGLKRLRALPDDTLVYCGHEYTRSNIAFALSIDPNNRDLQQRQRQVEDLLAQGQPTIPSRLGEEKRINPFLRADDPRLAAHYGLTPDDPAAVFAAIRKGKDNF